jgi:lipoprotein-releasing system permease protein
MNFPFFIAKRYFFSKKSRNAINTISAISIGGFMVGTMALVIVLSVFNGFEELATSLYSSFDPDLKITPREGKVFESSGAQAEKIRKVPGVAYMIDVLEEKALLQYADRQHFATIKGVEEDFIKMSGLDSMMVDGELILEDTNFNYAVVGRGIASYLSINPYSEMAYLTIYFPKRGKFSVMSPERAFSQKRFLPVGVFGIQQEFDDKYVLIPLRLARELLDYPTAVSAIEITLQPGTDAEKVQEEIAAIAGEKFVVKNRFQLHELLYQVMKSEKLAVYLILSFILLIAAFNVIGSLTMLVIDKQKDISILKSMGAPDVYIRRIFLQEGMIIALTGGILGIVLGLVICWLQMEFGLIRIQDSGTFVIDSYPVVIKWQDTALVLATTLVLGLLTSIYPAGKAGRQQLTDGLLK